jgi:outer membrane protein OmpA-like peptidoglycan-associated protein
MCFEPIRRLVEGRVWPLCGAVALALVVMSPRPASAETAQELAAQYGRAAMEQALQTKQRYDLYGIHFDLDKATIQPDTLSLLDDIAATLNQFPDWRLRIVGHTDSTGDAAYNETLSLERANAIKSALVEQGIDATRLDTAAEQHGLVLGAGLHPARMYR